MNQYVYFIGCEPMEAVKIGRTALQPHARLSALQTGCPSPLKLLAYFPGTCDDERRLHEAFAPLHIHLEWFRLCGKLEDLISYLAFDSPEASRAVFEDAIDDCLKLGCWSASHELSEAEYDATVDWRPLVNVGTR